MPGPDWDSRYADAPDGLFGRRVNAFVEEMTARADLVGSRVLCLADGDGRNSRWLAQGGRRVTAVDISAVATRNGERADREAGVEVNRYVCDLEVGLPRDIGTFDTALLIYLQAPWAVRKKAIEAGLGALVPGGRLIVEGFAKWPSVEVQADSPLGPQAVDLRYGKDELERAVDGATIEMADIVGITLDEGARHQGRAIVMRAVVRRD